jgi:diadenosine tetraphosphate (Ap4A) HIT family hydrolase
VICKSGPLDVIAELAGVWVTAPPEAPLPGYVCVVARRHANEPYELGRDEQIQFWLDSMLVAAAVASATTPIKMNYEVHGNTLPHLHLHLYPRHADDPFVGGPIDARRASVSRSAADLDALRKAIGQLSPLPEN